MEAQKRPPHVDTRNRHETIRPLTRESTRPRDCPGSMTPLLVGLALLALTGPTSPALAAGSAGAVGATEKTVGSTTVRRTPDGLVATGAQAPDFTLKDAGGNAVRLRDLLGKPLVLYFYPMDETPGCTAEACAFRDDMQRFDSLGVRVVGISTDGVASHRAFVGKHQLSFTVLSDTLAAVSRLYGVAYEIEVSGAKRAIARRVTYLIDGKGVVRHVWPKVDPVGSSTEVLGVVGKLLPEMKR